MLEWVASIETEDAGPWSDHKGVKMHLISPTDPIRVWKPARVYPVPRYAEKAVRLHTEAMLQAFGARVEVEQRTAADWAAEWDLLKTEIVKMTLKVKKERRRAARGGLQQTLKRLLAQQQRYHEEDRGVLGSVASITDLLDALTLEDVAGPTRGARIRRAIADCKRDLAEMKQRRFFREQSHWTGKTTKQMFRRVSAKHADNTVRRLDPVEGAPARGVHAKADTLADAWTPILQQQGAPPKKIEDVSGWMAQQETPTPAQQEVAVSITELEVRAAIQACKEGKATGPDRLGNDWYRAYADALAPTLATLMERWYEAGTFPASFLDADIFSLKKGGNQANALNYRPLALLNTDYKIFTRILATRLSPTLPERIHPNQAGIVPGRTIHETLHLFEAAQRMILADPEQADALALLLNFKKAYDSLDRNFMITVLRRHGYPEKFLRAIWSLHDGTTVLFLANGSKSRKIAVTSGIRQGCPLAPMLFILALEPLYRRVDNDAGISGVVIQSDAGRLELRVAGYADDTAVYLSSAAEVHRLREITRQFGQASGLQLNEGKTIAIALHKDGPNPETQLPTTMKFQGHGVSARYLGIHVGSGVPAEKSWEAADAQLRTRLSLASQKTTTVDQRSLIAAAIIVPKLTYIAQHAWPSTDTLNQFASKVRNYVWHAAFAKDVDGTRAWLDADLAGLERTSGGLAVPDLRAEVMAMAAVTVTMWATTGTSKLQIAGDVLFDGSDSGMAPAICITPNRLPPPPTGSRQLSTIWKTGRTLITNNGGGRTRQATPQHDYGSASVGVRFWRRSHHLGEGRIPSRRTGTVGLGVHADGQTGGTTGGGAMPRMAPRCRTCRFTRVPRGRRPQTT
ncbi:hypothetical protein PF003_g11658 [Phytophthora fragariae]|nr:hypothetical protein PF003_g11658 [Phytophthora fragariae]